MNRRRDALRAQVRTVTSPVALPVSTQDVLHELNLPATEAGRVTRLITTATELAEAYTNRAFITRSLQLMLDQFPIGDIPWWDGVREGTVRAFAGDGIMTLPKPPLVSVTSVQYFDTANTLRTVNASTYIVDAIAEPARLVLNIGATWPVDTRDRAAVLVNYTAGYGSTPASVPAIVKDAIISHVRDVVERPNSNVSSESIDNASVVYGAGGLGAAAALGANRTGGLRGEAPAMLASLRVMESGM
jgi:hypothetical protein